jgi:hypothetical protein
MTLKKNDNASVDGTCLQGYVHTTYAKLVETFGEPSPGFDDYKSDAEWLLTSEDGDVVTIYNYKDGKNYLGEDGTPVEDIIHWHIGGHSGTAVDLIRESIADANTTKGWY